MKGMLWRPRRVSKAALFLIAALSILGWLSVERFQRVALAPHYKQKIAAAKLARDAFDVLAGVGHPGQGPPERARRGITIRTEADPAKSGLIGALMTSVTSNPGDLVAKQTSVNPNFAALIVQYLHDAGVRPGDTVAVGFSGSFPAINTCVHAAMKTMQLRPLIISSVASSQWGANHPRFMWLDMEATLLEAGLIDSRSVAASLGGTEDRALGMSEAGQKRLRELIDRHKLRFVASETFESGVTERLQIYEEASNSEPIRVYINVGGGTVSVGGPTGKRAARPGLNRDLPAGVPVEGVMQHFLAVEIPAIHMSHIADLARASEFPVAPRQMPAVGQGTVFTRVVYNLWLVLGVLVAIFASLYLFIRSDLGFRMTRTGRKQTPGPPEPMV